VAKPNVTQIRPGVPVRALPPCEVLEERVEDQRERLLRVQNLLGVTRDRLTELAFDSRRVNVRAIEDCGGTLEICQEVVDEILEALDSVNLYEVGNGSAS
jgi:hypothetical protein